MEYNKKNKKDEDKEEMAINFYLDKEYKFTKLFNPKTTIEQLKIAILLKLSIYSINYIMEYNDHDIGGFDNFTIHQIFLNKNKEEYDIYLTLISTMKKYEGQRMLITYIEGESTVILYKILSMKWMKTIPEFSKRLSFYDTKKFPYNSRSCHIMQTNQLIITGGIDHEYSACFYDADTNALIDLPKMKYPRQRHTMISIGANKVLIIGGADSRKVTCLDVEVESYEDLSDMKYTRKDASACLVNERYLYVFMGYVDELGKIADNFEKLDIKEENGKFQIFPMNNFYSLKFPRTYCAVFFRKEDNYFYFFGGSYNSTMQASVLRFEEGKYSIEKFGSLILPVKTGFSETMFLRPNELNNDYYLFSFKENELIYFNNKEMTIKEIEKEWV